MPMRKPIKRRGLEWPVIIVITICVVAAAVTTGSLLSMMCEDAAIVLEDALERAEDAAFVFPAARLIEDEKAYGGLPGAWSRLVTPVLPGVTAHTLRHSFASIADDLGYSEATVAAMLGHAAGGVTRGYIHKVDDALVRAATAVSAEITGMMNA